MTILRKLLLRSVVVYAMLNHLAYIKDRIVYLVTRVDIESLEMFLVACSLWTGYRFVILQHTTPFLQLLSRTHPLWLWGWVALLSGVISAIGLIENVSVLRRLGILAGCLFWYYSGGILMVHFPSTYVPGLHIIVAFFATWCYCRIGVITVQNEYRAVREDRAATIPGHSFPVSL